MPWVRRISNHIWFCAGSCNMDPELLVEMWKSILYHIRNIHNFPGDKYTSWSHAPLPPESPRKRKWFKGTGKAFKALESVINDKRILKDLRQLNLFCHTGDLEVYHSMMLIYVPKRQEVAKRYCSLFTKQSFSKHVLFLSVCLLSMVTIHSIFLVFISMNV